MNRKDYRKHARSYQESIRTVLMDYWDPIGVRGVPEAADEYDSYVLTIFGMLVARKPRRELIDYLLKVETEWMGLSAQRAAIEAVVDRLLGLSIITESETHNVRYP